MSNWRDAILNDFVPHVSKLTLAADPDALLTEEKLALELRKRGFDLLEFNDPVEFRYAYESHYRALWDRGEHTDLVVILRLQDSELDGLPYDLLKAGRKLTFDLGELFPKLSYPVLEKLDRTFLDALFEAQRKFAPARLGDNATKDFILRHVFGIAAELITNEVELPRALLRLHYNRLNIPELLGARLIQTLQAHSGFHNWPLAEIVPDDKAFFGFLQERWPIFLDRLTSEDQVCEGNFEPPLKYSGPDVLPFDHQDIRVYIDNLFVEGKLTPVRKPQVCIKGHVWLRSGIAETNSSDDHIRLTRLFALIEKNLPTADMRYSDWLSLAMKWGELSSMVNAACLVGEQERFQLLGSTLNNAFIEWLSAHYASLINLPPTNPAMVHHVPRRLARELENGSATRVALLVVDGLAIDQWTTVRQILHEQDRRLVMREAATFAWIPTLTSVSRQALFAGKPPIYYPSSINITNNESSLWRQFWEGIGLSRLEIAYHRGLGDGDPVKALDATLDPSRTKALGLVVDKVDRIMHGMQLGAAGMHNQVKQWCQGGFLVSFIDHLLSLDYQVWLTSDHGNTECQGKGSPSEGVIAETRGERVRVYPTPELRDSVAKTFSFAKKWQPLGLPPGYYPLIAMGTAAFVKEGEAIVAHGGVSIEEVIVPLVKIERMTSRSIRTGMAPA